MFRFIYPILLGCLALISIPKILIGYLRYGKYKDSLPKRFGKGFPKIQKGDRRCIWIHAVSVGETKAIVPLAQMIKKEDPTCILILSTCTETAHAEGKRSLPNADYHVYLPFDFNWVIRPIVKQVHPDLVILCETDFWYNFLHASKEGGARIVLVNGKVSERSQERFLRYRFLSKHIFALIDLFCVQSKGYADRFETLGVPKNKIYATGNIKLDYPMKAMETDEINAWKQKMGLTDNQPLLVVGSSHDPEEKQILEAVKAVWKVHPELKLMLVPRHPERFSAVASLLDAENLAYVRYSQLEQASKPAKVILMDAMGLLRQAYQCCTVALVAGSFTDKVGGHNILEPSWYGKPVIYGPHMWSQPELVELMRDYGAGIQVEIEDLPHTLCELLDDSSKRTQMGQAGLKLLEESRGATQRTWDRVRDI